MDLFVSVVTKTAFSRLIDWCKVRINSWRKQKNIAQLIDETTMRATTVSSSVDLGARFKDRQLVEELLAHRSLLDIGKDEAIAQFLGNSADNSAYRFVAEFWDSVNAIMSVGEESLVDRKAIESLEMINQKVDLLLDVTGATAADQKYQKRALSNYCDRLVQYREETVISRRLSMRDMANILPQSDLAKCGQSVLVYANPGMGKSALMRFVASDIAKSWIDGDGNRIPVLIDARGWYRQYTSLAEGAAREIFGQSTELSMSFVRRNLSLFCFIVDGLDEARSERDLLFAELARYANDKEVQLICSSRFESDCTRIGINGATLLSLTDEEAVAYLTSKGIGSARNVMLRLNDKGRELMRNPLHLNCLFEYLCKNGVEAVPRNLSTIYGTCIAAMIEAKPDSDSGLDADYLQQQLGSYALECLTNQYAVPYRSFLIERFDAGEVERIDRASKASGLLIVSGGAARFSHAVFQEYLAARFLASQESAVIRTFCERYARDSLLKNFFEILCGCTADASKQALILDCLEKSNLALFMDCLRARMNLSDEIEKHLSREDIEAIALQALKTYTNISCRYLTKTKAYIPFWRTLSEPDAQIRIEVDYSVATTVIHVTLKERILGEDLVLVKLSDDEQGPVIVDSEGRTSPIFSMRVSSQPETHIYRIGTLYGGD